MPIPAHPRLATDSGQIVKYMTNKQWSFPSDEHKDLALRSDGSRPVYWSHPRDPRVTVRCTGNNGLCEPMLFGPPPAFRGSLRIAIPAGAEPQSTSDGHLTVVDQAGGWEYDFWQARWTNGRRTAMVVSSGGRIPIGPGTGTGLHGYAENAYLGLLGGLIRGPELVAGRIDHALAVTMPCVQYHDVWPAPRSGHGDSVCGNRGAGPHMGSLLQLNVGDALIARAPRWERAVLRAMKEYGMYVVDTEGGGTIMNVVREDDQSFTSFGYDAVMHRFAKRSGSGFSTTSSVWTVAGVPIDPSKLRVIDPACRGSCNQHHHRHRTA